MAGGNPREMKREVRLCDRIEVEKQSAEPPADDTIEVDYDPDGTNPDGTFGGNDRKGRNDASSDADDSEEKDERHSDARGTPEEEDENRVMTKCLKCGYLNLLNVTTCDNCRLHFVERSHEDSQRALALLREKIGIRTVWTARGFPSDYGRNRKNARKQLNRAHERGHANIAEYFRNDERYRAAKASEGWTQDNIHLLDELALTEAQHAPMSKLERENTYGRHADRVLPERVEGDSVRRPYELFPGEAETKGKGKLKGRGKGTHSTWDESYRSDQVWRSDHGVGERWSSTSTWSNVGSSDDTWWDARAGSDDSWSTWNPR
jgi:hypothetical protein